MSALSIEQNAAYEYLIIVLWFHGSVVDADVVDQAGEEGVGFHGLTGANV
jgi:hypothetical protein